ncbi:hypothetical protein O1611_g3482 [Lasiodiplodia mahajangana]|uniref:Uncharacterized protein n=1 Tax=Lasiodiplodia mahajangana TaxID=1108764 RepID=A0ACC2JSH0_9PEZI|nr:hypothetical protein O1611_g3482 [Lasiodiplodia mahajangana]
MPTEVFRFMDLPPEIRDQIYEVILCTWPPSKPELDEKKHILAIYMGRVYYRPKIDLGIALANHQLCHDAFNVMMKQNLFVRVSIELLNLGFPQFNVPIVALGSRVVNSFKGHVMSHSIRLRLSQRYPIEHILILWRDLDCFCQELAESNILFKQAKHTITITNPFVNTSTPHYLNLRNQASSTLDYTRSEELLFFSRLLQPYRKRLRGFTSFKVMGNVDPTLAEATMQEVSQGPPNDPKGLLRDILQRKELGQKYFDEGNINMASNTWCKASEKLFMLTTSDIWQKMKAKTEADWSNRLTEVYFQLRSGWFRSIVRAMDQQKGGEPGYDLYVDIYARVLERQIKEETYGSASDKFETSWQPTPAQEAERHYLCAMGYRIARVHINDAERYINIAAESLPDDRAIQQEKENIAIWRAEMGISS